MTYKNTNEETIDNTDHDNNDDNIDYNKNVILF